MGWLDASDQPSEAQEAAGSMVAFRRWRSGGGDQAPPQKQPTTRRTLSSLYLE
jgi:hypothetical protein